MEKDFRWNSTCEILCCSSLSSCCWGRINFCTRSHRVSRGFRVLSIFFFLWTSHSLHLSKQLDRCEHTGARVTGGPASHCDWITRDLYFMYVCVWVYTLEPSAAGYRSISEVSVGYHPAPHWVYWEREQHLSWTSLGAEWRVNKSWPSYSCVWI